MTIERLLTAEDVAEILGVKPPRIYQMSRDKQIPHIVIGKRQLRYTRSAIEKWLDNGGNQADQLDAQVEGFGVAV
jgi:excisionase family DNA binding protein